MIYTELEERSSDLEKHAQKKKTAKLDRIILVKVTNVCVGNSTYLLTECNYM